MSKFIERTVTDRPITCKYCYGDNIVKNGTYKGVQYFLCKNCNHRATGSDAYPKHQYDKSTITKALTYYYNGMSFEKVRNTFDDLDNIDISKSTLWEWINKFTKIVIPYVSKIKPTYIGDSWFADETMIMMYGKNKWLWSIIDEDTRYLLACNFTPNRTTKDATKLFYDAYLHAGKKPYIISTDKLQAYVSAFKKVFYSRYKKDKAYHLQSQGFVSPTNINLIERWHEYIKERTKIMRYFKSNESAYTILQGIIINYNYLWEHSYLDYISPAQEAGIDIKGMGIKNWGDLIELSQYNNPHPNPNEYTWYLDERKRIEGGS